VKLPSASSTSPEFTRFSKQQLLGMHALIDAKQIPVSKSQDLFQQIDNLEITLPAQPYAATLHRYHTVAKILLLIKVALIIAMLILGASVLFPDSPMIASISRYTASISTLPVLSSIITGILFIIVIIGVNRLRLISAALTAEALCQWWRATLQRWMPELAAEHDISTLSPDDIAHLVAVHARIKDINLELTAQTAQH
jgi:hypothetical protein